MKINLEFIANKANVSKALVSKVLNNRYVRISDEKRELIQKLAIEYNYQPNRIAASLRNQKANMIALILPTLYFEFFSQLVSTIESAARKAGYNVLVCNTDEELSIERHYLKLYRSGMIDGIIVSPSDNSANIDIINDINRAKFPLVFVDRYIENTNNSFATTDSYYGANILTKQLIQKGLGRISFLSHTNSPNTSVQIDRYKGYFDAITQSGLREKRYWIPKEHDTAKQLLTRILSSEEKPDAFVMVTSWDIMPLLHSCLDLGLDIPGDIEVAAFDKFLIPYTSAHDMAVSRVISRPLLLVDQNPVEMGQKAVELLFDKINSTCCESQKVFIKPGLVISQTEVYK